MDLVWFKLLQQSNEEGLRALFDKYYIVLCRYAYTLLEDETISEDIVQELFIYLWEKRHEISVTTSVKYYLFGSVRNKTLNYLRDNRKFTQLLQETDSSVYEDMSVETEELYRLIEEAVESLPQKCKDIFRLSRNEELSYKEIAAQREISVKTVEAQIHLAIKKVKKYLTSRYTNFVFFMISLSSTFRL